MPNLLIRNIPFELRRKLKELAVSNHLSLPRQAMVLLKQELVGRHGNAALLLPQPLIPKKRLACGRVVELLRKGRESDFGIS